MGLAGPRKRVKLSHDPNNTKWTKNTGSFGHKIMTSQGWQPGELLGAKNAPHAELHTAANASHIRVFLKDDNLGLGAKIGSGVGHGECTGLDVFQNLLGRLNGKDEEQLEKEQRSRDDLKIALYAERKWGVRFVKGGLLVGDKMQDLIDREADRIKKLEEEQKDSSVLKSEVLSSGDEMDSSTKSKSRPKIKEEENASEIVAAKVEKSKRKQTFEAGLDDLNEARTTPEDRVKVKRELDVDPEMDLVAGQDTKRQKKERREKKDKKDKKDKKEKKSKKEKGEKEKEQSSTSEEDISREERKRLKKEKRKAKLEAASASSAPSSESTTKENTPSVPATTNSSGRSTPLIQGRHLVRSRNIAQKRMASMDAAALNQIFMIKSQS